MIWPKILDYFDGLAPWERKMRLETLLRFYGKDVASKPIVPPMTPEEIIRRFTTDEGEK